MLPSSTCILFELNKNSLLFRRPLHLSTSEPEITEHGMENTDDKPRQAKEKKTENITLVRINKEYHSPLEG
jgi:hypothetical protein